MQLKILDTFDHSHSGLYTDILALTRPNHQFYPNYENWFEKVFIPGLKQKERLCIIAQNETGTLAGCALIKNTAAEKKICTLFVKPEFRKQGIGTNLVRQTIRLLGEHPLITVSQENIHQFFPLLTRQGFHLSSIRKDLYRKGSIEYFFNDKRADIVQQKLIPVLTKRAQQLEHC